MSWPLLPELRKLMGLRLARPEDGKVFVMASQAQHETMAVLMSVLYQKQCL